MFSSVVVSQGEKGSPVERPPRLIGDTSPPSLEGGGSKRLLGRPEKETVRVKNDKYNN